MADELIKYGFNLSSGGTDNNLLLIDLQNKGVNGAVAALALEVSGIVLNKNAVPNDPMPPFYPSGIRLGTPAITTRGLKEREMKKVAKWIHQTIEAVSTEKFPEKNGFDKLTIKEARSAFWKDFRTKVWKNKTLLRINREVISLACKYPLP